MNYLTRLIMHNGNIHYITAVHEDSDGMYLTIKYGDTKMLINVKDVHFGDDKTSTMYSPNTKYYKYQIRNVLWYNGAVREEDGNLWANIGGCWDWLALETQGNGELVSYDTVIHMSDVMFMVYDTSRCKTNVRLYKYPLVKLVWADIRNHYLLCAHMTHTILDIRKIILSKYLLVFNSFLQPSFKFIK